MIRLLRGHLACLAVLLSLIISLGLGGAPAAATGAQPTAQAAASRPGTWYHKETIGHSGSGRPIVAYRAGEPGKPVVMVVATMHGEENFGQYVARGLLEGSKIGG